MGGGSETCRDLTLRIREIRPGIAAWHLLKYQEGSRCPANMAQLRQSRPDSGLGFLVKDLQVVPSSLGRGWHEHLVRHRPHPQPPPHPHPRTPRSRRHSPLHRHVKTLQNQETLLADECREQLKPGAHLHLHSQIRQVVLTKQASRFRATREHLQSF